MNRAVVGMEGRTAQQRGEEQGGWVAVQKEQCTPRLVWCCGAEGLPSECLGEFAIVVGGGVVRVAAVAPNVAGLGVVVAVVAVVGEEEGVEKKLPPHQASHTASC